MGPAQIAVPDINPTVVVLRRRLLRKRLLLCLPLSKSVGFRSGASKGTRPAHPLLALRYPTVRNFPSSASVLEQTLEGCSFILPSTHWPASTPVACTHETWIERHHFNMSTMEGKALGKSNYLEIYKEIALIMSWIFEDSQGAGVS